MPSRPAVSLPAGIQQSNQTGLHLRLSDRPRRLGRELPETRQGRKQTENSSLPATLPRRRKQSKSSGTPRPTPKIHLFESAASLGATSFEPWALMSRSAQRSARIVLAGGLNLFVNEVCSASGSTLSNFRGSEAGTNCGRCAGERGTPQRRMAGLPPGMHTLLHRGVYHQSA